VRKRLNLVPEAADGWEADAAVSAGRTVAVGSALSPQEIAGGARIARRIVPSGPSDIGGVPLTQVMASAEIHCFYPGKCGTQWWYADNKPAIRRALFTGFLAFRFCLAGSPSLSATLKRLRESPVK
jgi:hypothetical protein